MQRYFVSRQVSGGMLSKFCSLPPMRLNRFARLLLFFTFWSASLQHGFSQVLISEFMASNTRSVPDEDGDYSDWIEIYNGSPEPVNLEGWHLTDSPTELAKWRFPSTLLLPNGRTIVFASEKNRAVAGAQLHTNFKISSGGEYLALVKPDGRTVASAYTPQYPVQVPDISFGVPIQQTVVPLIPNAASAKVLVPANDTLGTAWIDPEWNDSAWTSMPAAIGYERGSPTPIQILVADSAAEFSGRQGQDNWSYGYYNKTTDKVTGYAVPDFIPFPRSDGYPSASNFWNGTTWDWFKGDPPGTEIGPTYTRPNGINNGHEHWPIRRWASEVSGTLTIKWKLAKQDPNGRGVTGRVFHQGLQKDLVILAGDNITGVVRTNILTDVKIGDFIDFALAPAGVANSTDDGSDASHMSASIQVTASLGSQVQGNTEALMHGVGSSAYLRIPFVVSDPSVFEFLTMRMKYDDGFAAYLNGLEVARRNAPDDLTWASAATAARENSEAAQFEDFNLSHRLGLLRPGGNLLAIHALNASPADSDFLLVPELHGITAKLEGVNQRYFSLPTPGDLNGPGKINLGPLIVDALHSPALPSNDDDIIVTARIAPTFEPADKVTLYYRVMFTPDVAVPMSDDGLHGDGAPNDGVYGAVIPASASAAGQMVRYYVTATDSSGDLSRSPPYLDPRNSPQYWGAVVNDPTVTSALPVLQWFIQNTSAADNTAGTRSSLFFAGEFYDNVAVNLHGQSSSGFPKKSYNFDMNTGHHFRYDAKQRKVEDFNLLTTYPDKSHMRNLLAYETYRDAGSPYHIAFALRVQRNGAFFSDAHFVEDGDEDYLARLGLDSNGALYKMYNVLDNAAGGAEKKTRKYENNADLQALITGVRRTGTARTQFLFDNINLPAMANFLAAMIITGGVDCCHKNYYAYRDSNGTGEWQYLPWDVDLTFGRNWNSANTYFDDTMFPNNSLFIGDNNLLISALFANTSFRQMYLRRVRTLMDNLLQSTNTPPEHRKYERRIDELTALIGPDAALDYAKWPTWGRKQTLPQAVEILRNQYLPARRNYLFRNSQIPGPQPTNATIGFGLLDYFPPSGNQDEEYIQMANTNTYAVDISNWKLNGAVTHTFAPGVVIPAKGFLYLSPHVVAFRARTNGFRGGQSLFVQGNYQGRLSARGGTLRLWEGTREVASFAYPGEPTAAQQNLRIIEIMYAPSVAPAGSIYMTEDFEYLQLKNVGETTLDLAGVHFADGISFDFSRSPVKSLPAGHAVYLVKNIAAFQSRYGIDLNIAGPYKGQLENGGETLRLNDGTGETVLEFAYENAWHPGADGKGFSLMAANEKADWSVWGDRLNWTQSLTITGTPAENGPTLAAWRARYFTAEEIANASISGDNADPDGDRRDNRQEFMSGTDPRNSQSFLRIEVMKPSGESSQRVAIRLEAAAGKSYTVQHCDMLNQGAWQKLLDVPRQPLNRVIEFSDDLAGQKSPARYYRVVTPRQP